MNVFITGKPGCGKSTLISELINAAEERGIRYCGIITPEIRERGSRTGFKIVALPSDEEEIFASVRFGYPKISKYGINIEAIDRIVSIVEERITEADVVFIDEIGKMEMLSKRFRGFLGEVLRSDKKLIATLSLALVSRFKRYGRILLLTRENYGRIKEDLGKHLN